jgi:hypothetical protein
MQINYIRFEKVFQCLSWANFEVFLFYWNIKYRVINYSIKNNSKQYKKNTIIFLYASADKVIKQITAKTIINALKKNIIPCFSIC